MTDFESLEDKPKKKEKVPENDFPSMGVDLTKKINFKVALFLLLVSVVIFSDVFVNMLPQKYREGGPANSQGTMIQIGTLTGAYVIIDLLVQGDIL